MRAGFDDGPPTGVIDEPEVDRRRVRDRQRFAFRDAFWIARFVRRRCADSFDASALRPAVIRSAARSPIGVSGSPRFIAFSISVASV
jgi:hypothetical protein